MNTQQIRQLNFKTGYSDYLGMRLHKYINNLYVNL